MTFRSSGIHSTLSVIDSINRIKEEARRGNPQMQYELGMRYKNGEGVKLSYQKAVYWLGQAGDFYRDNRQFEKAFDIYQIEKTIWLNEAWVNEGKDLGLANSLKKIELVWSLDYGDNPLCTAELYDTIGKELQELGHFERALEYAEKSLDIREEVYGSKDCIDIAASLNNIGGIFLKRGNFVHALGYLQRALVMKERILDPNDHRIADSLNNVGEALAHLGRFDEALKYHEKSLEMRKKIDGSKATFINSTTPNTGMAHLAVSSSGPNVVQSLNNIGGVLLRLSRFNEALEQYQASLKMNNEMYDSGTHPEIALSLGNVGGALRCLGDFKEALTYYQSCLEMNMAIYVSGIHPEIAVTLDNIGGVLRELGHFEEALEYHKKSLEMSNKIWTSEGFHPEIGNCLNNIALVYSDLGRLVYSDGRLEEASKYYQDSLKRTYGTENHPGIADYLNNIGGILYKLNDFERALEYYRESLKMMEKIYSSEDSVSGMSNFSTQFPSIESSNFIPCFEEKAGNFLEGEIAQYLWLNPSLPLAEEMIRKVNEAAVYLRGQGFELMGIKADGNCFCNAFLQSYKTLSEPIPILDREENKVSYLRGLIANQYGTTPKESTGAGITRVQQIKKDRAWLAADEGDLLARALSIPIRIVTVNQDRGVCGISDMLTLKDGKQQSWDTIEKSARPEKSILIVDLGGHFIYAQPLSAEKDRRYQASSDKGQNNPTHRSKDHPDIAGCLHNMGLVLEKLGRFEEAFKYYQRLLEIEKRGCRPVVIDEPIRKVLENFRFSESKRR